MNESNLNLFSNLNLPIDIELKLTKMLIKQDDIIDSIKIANNYIKVNTKTENFIDKFNNKLNDIKINFTSYNEILKSIDPKINIVIENFSCANGTLQNVCNFANNLAKPFTDATDKVTNFIHEHDPKTFFDNMGKTIFSSVTDTFNNIINSINNFIQGIKSEFENLFKSIEKFISDLGNVIADPFKSIFTVVKSIVDLIVVVFHNIITVLIDLPYILQYSWDIINMCYIFATRLYNAPIGTVILAFIGTIINILYFRILFGIEPDPMFSVFVGSSIALIIMYNNNDDAILVQNRVLQTDITTIVLLFIVITIVFFLIQFIL